MNKRILTGRPANHRGVALIFALLLLVILTILGVGTLSTVSMQERMAGNANLQALAFEAASAGVSETVGFWLDQDNWPADARTIGCSRGLGQNWATGWSSPPTPLEFDDMPDGFTVQYQTRLGCFEAEGWQLLTGSDFAPPQQLLALSRGVVLRPDGETIAEREIEVRLERRGGNPTCAVQTGPLDQVELEMPSSQSFGIDGGEGGCPIKTAEADDAAAMREQLRDKQIGNYKPTEPGITSGELDGAWGNPEMLARAVNAIKIGVRAYEAYEVWNSQDPSSTANPFSSCAGRLYPDDQKWGNNCGNTDPGLISYVAGDLDVGGDCVLEGTIISEGALLSNGTPAYLGNMIFLGGKLDVRGFGNAGNSGLFVLHNLQSNVRDNSERTAYDKDFGFADSDFIIRGGGNATVELDDCESLEIAWAELNQCLADLQRYTENESWSTDFSNEFEYYIAKMTNDLDDVTSPIATFDVPELVMEDDVEVRFPDPQCGPDGLGRRNVIASWREFIDAGRWDAENFDCLGPDC